MAIVGETVSNVTNSRPGKDSTHKGALWVAPFGTVVPTDARTPLDAAFKCLGLITDDGVTEPAALSAGDDTTAYGGDKVFTADPEYNKTLTANFLEIKNITLLKQMYGSENVTESANADGDIKVVEGAFSPDHQVFVYDEMLKGGYRWRHIYNDATALATGDLQHATTDPMSVEITISAYPDATGASGVNYIQTKKDSEHPAGSSLEDPTAQEDEEPESYSIPEV